MEKKVGVTQTTYSTMHKGTGRTAKVGRATQNATHAHLIWPSIPHTVIPGEKELQLYFSIRALSHNLHSGANFASQRVLKNIMDSIKLEPNFLCFWAARNSIPKGRGRPEEGRDLCLVSATAEAQLSFACSYLWSVTGLACFCTGILPPIPALKSSPSKRKMTQ